MKKTLALFCLLCALVVLLPGCFTPDGAARMFEHLKDDPAEITIMSPYFSVTRKMPANWVPPARDQMGTRVTHPSEAPTVHVFTRTNAPAPAP